MKYSNFLEVGFLWLNNKEEKKLKFPRDGYEVAIYAETGRWTPKDQGEVDKKFLGKYPEFILINPELNKELFSEEEFNHLVALGKKKRKRRSQKESEAYFKGVKEKKGICFLEEETERLEQFVNEQIRECRKKIKKMIGYIYSGNYIIERKFI